MNTETLQTLFVEQAFNDTLAVLVDRADEANKQFRIACIDIVWYSGYGPCWEIVNNRLGPLCNFWLDGAEPPDYKPQPITAESLKAQFEDVLQTAKLVEEDRPTPDFIAWLRENTDADPVQGGTE